MNLIPRDLIGNFDSIFDNFFAPSRLLPRETGNLMPSVDIKETDNNYVIKADMPGINKDDLSVVLKDGVLTIQAEHKDESEEKEGEKVIRRERRLGQYIRSFNVGRDVQESDINGTFNDGVLTLTVPKAGPKEESVKRISID